MLVLTKPLGTQVAVNVHQWRGRPAFDKVAGVSVPWPSVVDHVAMSSVFA